MERVGLDPILIHNPISLVVYPGFPEQTCPELKSFVELSFGLNNWLEMF